jgi:glycosyltransferase involved in cell wall biosynthesis
MTKILYYGISDVLGGIESFIVNVYRNIDKEKFQIDFAAPMENICFEKEFIESGSKIYTLPARNKNPFKFYKAFWDMLRSHPEYQIVHLHLQSCSCFEPVIIAKLLGRKTIVHSHNAFRGTRKVTRILDSSFKMLVPAFSDVNLACSDLAGKYMFKDRSFQVINNAVDAGKFSYNEDKREQYRKELGLEERFVLGHIGRFDEQKNHEFLADIFNETYKKDKSAFLLMVGVGNLKPKIQEKLKQYGLENQYMILENRSDIPGLMQAMDVFVFPSLFEGLPLVLVEAQAAGLTCVIADTISKTVQATDLVVWCSLEEAPEEWAIKILNQKNANRRNTLNEIIEAGYEIKHEISKLEKIYEELDYTIKQTK